MVKMKIRPIYKSFGQGIGPKYQKKGQKSSFKVQNGFKMAPNYKMSLIKVVKYININNLTKWHIILTKYMVRRAKNKAKLSNNSLFLT